MRYLVSDIPDLKLQHLANMSCQTIQVVKEESFALLEEIISVFIQIVIYDCLSHGKTQE